MGPRDHPRPLPDGAACTACGAAVATEAIRILARRDDLAFVEFACPACASTSLGILLSETTVDGPPILDVATDGTPSSGLRPARLRPITAADVEAVRRDLAAWDGDLVGWLDAMDGDRRGSVVDR
jgi:hypothetical protein